MTTDDPYGADAARLREELAAGHPVELVRLRIAALAAVLRTDPPCADAYRCLLEAEKRTLAGLETSYRLGKKHQS